MHKISEKDKIIWNYYTSNLNSIKKGNKNKKFKSSNISVFSKDLKTNTCFELDSKIKKQLKYKKTIFDAIVDLHGKTEIQAYETVINFIKKSYFGNLKSVVIITGKGVNSQGKLKLKTPIWLKSSEISKFVVGFETMPHNKGGDGVLYVKLKNKDKYK